MAYKLMLIKTRVRSVSEVYFGAIFYNLKRGNQSSNLNPKIIYSSASFKIIIGVFCWPPISDELQAHRLTDSTRLFYYKVI